MENLFYDFLKVKPLSCYLDFSQNQKLFVNTKLIDTN